jgi:hypothetical protein
VIKDRLNKVTKSFMKTLKVTKKYPWDFSPEAHQFIQCRHIELIEVFDELESVVSKRKVLASIKRKKGYIAKNLRQLEDELGIEGID